MNRDFNTWLNTMKHSVATWTYYTDFKRVYENVSKIKIELNILNSLIGSSNIEEEFKNILETYPNVLKVIPILLAKRELEIEVMDNKGSYDFSFVEMNYSIEQYCLFMKNSGLFDLIQNHIINNLVDYVLGVEVGMDTNGRKQRGGRIMADIVESYLIAAGLEKGKTYFVEMTSAEVESRFGIDLSSLTNNGKASKRFDFVFVGAFGNVFACECNYYNSSGSKLNETARSYKTLTEEAKNIKGFNFVWFTDGRGWFTAKNNLEETFDVLEHLYNISDLENKVINNLVDPTKYLAYEMKM